MKSFSSKCVTYLARFTQVQLFLSLASLPIIISWGLPLSVMAPIGNLVFGPFLALFLLCSSLIFFTELLTIPNGLFIFILDKVSTLWLGCLSWGSKHWLIGLYKPPLIPVICIVLCGFFVMQHKKLGQLYPSIVCLSILLIGTTGYLVLSRPRSCEFHVPCAKRQVQITVSQGTVTLEDHGALARKFSPESWVQYNLLSELTQQIGSTTIHRVIIKDPGTLTFQALTALCEHADVKVIELPYWNHELSKAGWRAFFCLRSTAKKEKTTIVRIPLQKD